MANRLVSVGDDFTLPAAVKVANTNLPAHVQPAALADTYAPTTAMRPGSALAPIRAAAIGDSTTAGITYTPEGVNVLVSNTWVPMQAEGMYQVGYQSWFTHMCLQSGGQILNWFNAGVGSDTTSGMLARFQTDVVDKSPDVVFMGNAHNDFSAGSGIDEALTRSNILAMVALAQKNGIGVIFVTNHPDNAAIFAVPIRRHNRWLKRHGELNRIPVIDIYAALVDPASPTGAFLPAYTYDGTHATPLGAKVAGAAALEAMSGILRGKRFGSPWLPTDSVTEINALANPLMLTDANVDYRPDSWSVSHGSGTARTLTDVATTNASAVITSATGAFTSADLGRIITGTGLQANTFIKSVESATQATLMKTATATATGVTATIGGTGVQLVTDPLVPAGKLIQFTVGAGTAELYQTIPVDGVKFSVGDRIKWCGVFSATSTSALSYQLALTFTGVANWGIKPVHQFTGVDYALSYFECEAVIQPGATAIKPDLYVAAGTGVVRSGMWSLINVTKLG